MSDKLSFRFAQRKDAALIFDFIMRIAEYEKMTDEVLNTPEMVEKQLFCTAEGRGADFRFHHAHRGIRKNDRRGVEHSGDGGKAAF